MMSEFLSLEIGRKVMFARDVPSSLSCQAVLSPTLLPLPRELLCRDEDMVVWSE